MSKPPDITSTADAKAKIPDIKVTGNPDTWQLLTKASKDGDETEKWYHSTKAMEIPGFGVVLLVDSRENGQTTKGLAVLQDPGLMIVSDDNGGRKIVKR